MRCQGRDIISKVVPRKAVQENAYQFHINNKRVFNGNKYAARRDVYMYTVFANVELKGQISSPTKNS